jgi:hypothetical protein
MKVKNQCQSCGSLFERDQDEKWKRICLECWKLKKRQEERQSGKADSSMGAWTQDKEKELARLRFEVAQLRSRVAVFERDKMMGRNAQVDVDKEMMRRLLSLCHPDKNNQSESSLKATQFLLKLKQAVGV